MKSWLFIFLISFSVCAQTVTTKIKEPHSTGTVMVGYEIFASWLPFRWTGSYTHLINKKWSAEAEWSRGYFGTGIVGYDLASVSENRFSLVARKYVGNSLNLIFGGFKNDFHAKLGSELLDDTTGVNDFRVQGLGLAVGIGNRWQWQNGFTFGVEWFRMNVPLFDKKVDSEVLDNITDKNDIAAVKNAIDKVKNVPTFVLLGINLGYTF